MADTNEGFYMKLQSFAKLFTRWKAKSKHIVFDLELAEVTISVLSP